MMILTKGRLIACSILAVLIVLCLVFFYNDKINYLKYSKDLILNDSTNMDAHKFSVGGREFCVAKAYFIFSDHIYAGADLEYSFSMSIQDIEPWNVYLDKLDYDARKRNMSRVQINEFNSKKMTVKLRGVSKGGNQIDKHWKFFLKGVTMEEYGRFSKLLPGKETISIFDYHLIPRDADDYSYVVGCVSGARCVLERYYDESLAYLVSFDERYLSVVDDADIQARAFINKSLCK